MTYLTRGYQLEAPGDAPMQSYELRAPDFVCLCYIVYALR